jgi:hypothetical protein
MPARSTALPGCLAKRLASRLVDGEAGAARALHHVRQGERKPRTPESNNLASSAGQSRKPEFGMRKKAGREAIRGVQLARKKNAPVCASDAGECAKNKLAASTASSLVRALHCVEARYKAGL